VRLIISSEEGRGKRNFESLCIGERVDLQKPEAALLHTLLINHHRTAFLKFSRKKGGKNREPLTGQLSGGGDRDIPSDIFHQIQDQDEAFVKKKKNPGERSSTRFWTYAKEKRNIAHGDFAAPHHQRSIGGASLRHQKKDYIIKQKRRAQAEGRKKEVNRRKNRASSYNRV